jgi:hypothetical protein
LKAPTPTASQAVLTVFSFCVSPGNSLFTAYCVDGRLSCLNKVVIGL